MKPLITNDSKIQRALQKNNKELGYSLVITTPEYVRAIVITIDNKEIIRDDLLKKNSIKISQIIKIIIFQHCSSSIKLKHTNIQRFRNRPSSYFSIK